MNGARGKSVLVFGVFDGIHPGHKYFLQQARELGDLLTVILTQDDIVMQQKNRQPDNDVTERLAEILTLPYVNAAYVGDSDPNTYKTLQHISFDILALGYDQGTVVDAKTVLARIGKPDSTVVQIDAFHPEKYKTSIVRGTIKK